MTTYMEKYPRRNGVAAKKPGFWKRRIMGIIPWKGDSVGVVIRKIVFTVALIVFLVTAVPLVSETSGEVRVYRIYISLTEATTAVARKFCRRSRSSLR